MDIVTYNLSWMVVNVILALVPVVLTKVLKKKIKGVLKFVFWIAWFLFLPNTIYLVTDLQYFPQQFFASNYNIQLVLIGMYLGLTILGIVSFLYTIKTFEIGLTHFRVKAKNKGIYYVVLNFLVALAMVMGKIERTESWDVFVSPIRVARDMMAVFYRPEWIGLAVVFGIFVNLLYFGTKRLRIGK